MDLLPRILRLRHLKQYNLQHSNQRLEKYITPANRPCALGKHVVLKAICDLRSLVGPALQELHWLPIPSRITLKVAL